jgi:hypothetical protein
MTTTKSAAMRRWRRCRLAFRLRARKRSFGSSGNIDGGRYAVSRAVRKQNAAVDRHWQYVHSTPLAAAVAQIDNVGRSALERDVLAGWRSFVRDGALVFDANAVLTTARK